MSRIQFGKFKIFLPVVSNIKYDQGNDSINWKINKKMEDIHKYPGHNKKPLFYMIPLDKWVPDELHILL
jgi:hypothetical protein